MTGGGDLVTAAPGTTRREGANILGGKIFAIFGGNQRISRKRYARPMITKEH